MGCCTEVVGKAWRARCDEYTVDNIIIEVIDSSSRHLVRQGNRVACVPLPHRVVIARDADIGNVEDEAFQSEPGSCLLRSKFYSSELFVHQARLSLPLSWWCRVLQWSS